MKNNTNNEGRTMKFKVGDKVRVRAWDDMEKEFGLDKDGDISCRGCFTKGMKKYCGEVFEIYKVNNSCYNLTDTVYNFSDDMLEPVCDKKIVITSDGKTTLARLYDGKEVIKSVEVNCPEYFDNLITELESLDKTDKPEAKAEKPFVPHLELDGKNYGEIGKKTKYTDIVGRRLYVGDVVEHFNVCGTSFGDTVIVEDESKQFVMGIKCCCNDKDGSINDGWKIVKKRSHKDVKNGEEIYCIKYVTE